MGAKHTIARIRNPEYNDKSLDFMKKQLGLSMSINPELLAARELLRILQMPSAVKVESFAARSFEMVEIKLPEDSELAGLSLRDLREKYKTNILIGAVQRGDEVHIPDGNFILNAGDRIGLVARHSDIVKFLRSIGMMRKQAKSVMIVGGSRTAYYLADMLSSVGTSVKIIEKNPVLCHELSDLLPDTSIICGDGAEQEVLLEEGIRSTDAFVALTGMDEENILISIYAGLQNVPKVISKVSREELTPMAKKLGLDCVVSPSHFISDVLVRYARALDNSLGSNIETLYRLMDGKIEALEFISAADPRINDIPLRDLATKPNILIAGIIHGRRMIVPGGNDCIQAGDRVIILSENQRLSDLSDILR
jgi:trk system potassium uptake protein TrkA